MSIDPVSNVSSAVTAGFSFGEAVTALITKTLPSDADKAQAFQARYPKIYATVRLHALKQMFRYLRHHQTISVAEYVDFVGGAFTDAERKELTDILNEEIKPKK